MFKGKRKKKSVWYFLLPTGLALMAMVLVFLATQEDVEISLKELELTEIGKEQYAFLSLEGSKIEIGTNGKNPYLSLEKWDEEVSFTLGMPYQAKFSVLSDNKVRFSTAPQREYLSWWRRALASVFTFTDDDQPQIDIDFYPLQSREIVEKVNGEEYRFTQLKDGGVKFDITIHQEPDSNIISFPMETQGLKFYYQPELTPEEIEGGAFRPEHVVGSYAVYHESKRDHIIGQTNYKTGKAFHIYPPKLIDAGDNKAKGILSIDAENGIYSVEIPQEFLDKAVYPIRSNDAFGYDTAGSTNTYLASDGHNNYYLELRQGNPYTPNAGTLTKISTYVRNYSDDDASIKVFLNEKDSEGTNSHGQTIVIERTNIPKAAAAWRDFIGEASLSNVSYILNATADASILTGSIPAVVIYLDSVDDQNLHTSQYDSPDYKYNSPEDPWNAQHFLGTTACFSIYATYEVEEEEVEPPTVYFTSYSFQRKTWYDGTRYWRAFHNGAEIEFQYSTDGESWTTNDSATISISTQ